MPYAMNPDPQPVPLPKARYRGWAWRGAHLDIAQLAAYEPDLELKHLGEARACLGPLTSQLKETPDIVDSREASPLHSAQDDTWAGIYRDIQTAIAEGIPQSVVPGRPDGNFPPPASASSQIHPPHQPGGPDLETPRLAGDPEDE